MRKGVLLVFGKEGGDIVQGEEGEENVGPGRTGVHVRASVLA